MKLAIRCAQFSLALLLALLITSFALLGKKDLPEEYIYQQYANDTSRFIATKTGNRFHYQIHGESDKPALLLLHGFMSSLYDYDEWIEELSSDFYIIRVDLPGMGLSAPNITDDYSQRGLTEAIHDFVQAISLENFSIAGHSRGGSVAWAYTVLYPNKVDKLILNAASGLAFEQNNDGNKPLSFRIAETPIVKEVLRYIAHPKSVKRSLNALVYNQHHVSERWVMRMYELSLHNNNRDRMVRMRPFIPDQSLIAKLPSIRQPTLILWGENDALTPISHGERYKRAIPQATFIRFEKMGHFPQIEAPKITANAVRTFLNNGPL